MNPAVSIMALVLLIPVGVGIAWFSAPQAVTQNFQIHAKSGQAWFNVSQSFSGWGKITAYWTNLPGPWANLTVYACASSACDVDLRTQLFTVGPYSFEGSSGGLTSHHYLILGTNLTWTGNGTVTFGFGPSILSPVAMAVTGVEVAGIVMATVGGVFVLRLAFRMSR
jgi:hypothetical protein